MFRFDHTTARVYYVIHRKYNVIARVYCVINRMYNVIAWVYCVINRVYDVMDWVYSLINRVYNVIDWVYCLINRVYNVIDRVYCLINRKSRFIKLLIFVIVAKWVGCELKTWHIIWCERCQLLAITAFFKIYLISLKNIYEFTVNILWIL